MSSKVSPNSSCAAASGPDPMRNDLLGCTGPMGESDPHVGVRGWRSPRKSACGVARARTPVASRQRATRHTHLCALPMASRGQPPCNAASFRYSDEAGCPPHDSGWVTKVQSGHSRGSDVASDAASTLPTLTRANTRGNAHRATTRPPARARSHPLVYSHRARGRSWFGCFGCVARANDGKSARADGAID